MDPVIGRELDRLGRNQRHVHGDRAQLVEDHIQPLARQIRHAKQHQVDLALARQGDEVIEAADHLQSVDLIELRPIVGDPDHAQMRQLETVEHAPDHED